jgi:hypothetical protein
MIHHTSGDSAIHLAILERGQKCVHRTALLDYELKCYERLLTDYMSAAHMKIDQDTR